MILIRKGKRTVNITIIDVLKLRIPMCCYINFVEVKKGKAMQSVSPLRLFLNNILLIFPQNLVEVF